MLGASMVLSQVTGPIFPTTVQSGGFTKYDSNNYPIVAVSGLSASSATSAPAVKITDGTNTAAVTASKALMVEHGPLSYLIDTVALGGTNNVTHIGGFAQTATNFTFHVSLADTNRPVHIAGGHVTIDNEEIGDAADDPVFTKPIEGTNSCAGFSKVVSVTPKQGADGTIAAFTANDAASYPFEIDCARANGKGVYLNNIVATVGIDCSTTPPAFELYLFDSYPTLSAPEEPWDMADDQLSKVVGGPYSIPTTYWAAQGTLNGIMQTNTYSTLILPASNSTKLYGVLKAKNTWTPGATNDLVLKFKFMQD